MKSHKTLNSSSSSMLLRIVASLTLVATTATAQPSFSLSYSGHRPLAGSLDALESALGVPINYEDVPYSNPEDLEDVAPEYTRSANPGFRLMVPRKGAIKGSKPMTGAISDGIRIGHISDLLVSYRNNRNPGDFKIEQANGMIYVIAAKVSGADGVERTVQSPMTARVTLPHGERRFIDAIDELLREAEKTTGARIDVGELPISPITKISFGANNEPLRDVIARVMASVRVRPSYPCCLTQC